MWAVRLFTVKADLNKMKKVCPFFDSPMCVLVPEVLDGVDTVLLAC